MCTDTSCVKRNQLVIVDSFPKLETVSPPEDLMRKTECGLCQSKKMTFHSIIFNCTTATFNFEKKGKFAIQFIPLDKEKWNTIFTKAISFN